MTLTAPRLLDTRAGLRSALAAATDAGRPVAAVLTMGALHDGHQALVRRVRSARPDALVVVTVFVNPLQFGPGEDLQRYPRDLPTDVLRAGDAGADVVWAPPLVEVYPDGTPRVTVDPGPLGSELEGAARPGHFAGVLTVVAKMLGLVRPEVTAFGEKDYQQLVLVARMARDLEFGVEVVGVETVREPDGLARSSRNAYLDPDARRQAAAIPAALAAGAAAASRGAPAVLSAAGDVLARAGIAPDYLVLRAVDLGPAPGRGPARLLVAGRVGGTRLLDNVAVQVG